MCLFHLAGSSRRFDSGCLWAGLASLQVSPPCRNIVRALYHHKVGKAAWPSLQQVRSFLAEELKGLHGCLFITGCSELRCQIASVGCQSGQITPTLVTGLPDIQPGGSLTLWRSQLECTLPSCFPGLVCVYCTYFHAQSQEVSFPLVGGFGPRAHL